MYELNHIIGNSYYIQSPSKMGLGEAERYRRLPD